MGLHGRGGEAHGEDAVGEGHRGRQAEDGEVGALTDKKKLETF